MGLSRDTSTTGSKGEIIVSAIARKERAPRLERFASTSSGLRYSEKNQDQVRTRQQVRVDARPHRPKYHTIG